MPTSRRSEVAIASAKEWPRLRPRRPFQLAHEIGPALTDVRIRHDLTMPEGSRLLGQRQTFNPYAGRQSLDSACPLKKYADASGVFHGGSAEGHAMVGKKHHVVGAKRLS